MKKINRRGFTLIELLLVIAIIGILAAVLFVSLGSQRDRARVTAFKESMRSTVPAATICRDQTGTILVGVADGTNAICTVAGSPNIPEISACDGSGGFVTITETITSGGLGTDGWEIESTCSRSNGDTCKATCASGGCSYDGAGCN
ncbi:MAG: type II secretion system protein [Patescibacteria group bacterium]|nr:type II secretion system protein [Patescibacteria group bacterium]